MCKQAKAQRFLRAVTLRAVATEEYEGNEAELAEQMAEFLRRQAETESGGLVAVPDEPPQEVLGAEVISEEVWVFEVW